MGRVYFHLITALRPIVGKRPESVVSQQQGKLKGCRPFLDVVADRSPEAMAVFDIGERAWLCEHFGIEHPFGRVPVGVEHPHPDAYASDKLLAVVVDAQAPKMLYLLAYINLILGDRQREVPGVVVEAFSGAPVAYGETALAACDWQWNTSASSEAASASASIWTRAGLSS